MMQAAIVNDQLLLIFGRVGVLGNVAQPALLIILHKLRANGIANGSNMIVCKRSAIRRSLRYP